MARKKKKAHEMTDKLIRREVFERMIATNGPGIAYTDPVTRELDYNLWQTIIHKSLPGGGLYVLRARP